MRDALSLGTLLDGWCELNKQESIKNDITITGGDTTCFQQVGKGYFKEGALKYQAFSGL